MRYLLVAILALVACNPDGDNDPTSQEASVGGIVITDNDGSIITISPSDSGAANDVQEAIAECCPFFIGLADDDCILQNFPGLPDDLCRGEPLEDGTPTPRSADIKLRVQYVDGQRVITRE